MSERRVGGVHTLTTKLRTDDPRRDLRNIWQKVYARKSGIELKDNSGGKQINEKQRMYLEALDQLGFFNALNESSVILQGGVGHGRTLTAIIDWVLNCETYGLDISHIALQNSANNPTCHQINGLINGDICQLPFGNNTVDRVFEVGVVEHLYEGDYFSKQVVDLPKVVESFKELYRVLKPGGKACFIQPSQHSFQGISKILDQWRGEWNMGFQEDFSIMTFAQLLQLGNFPVEGISFCVMQAPSDFPKEISILDKALQTYYIWNNKPLKAELTGALFAMIATKPLDEN